MGGAVGAGAAAGAGGEGAVCGVHAQTHAKFRCPHLHWLSGKALCSTTCARVEYKHPCGKRRWLTDRRN
eukprot:gene16115-38312_t